LGAKHTAKRLPVKLVHCEFYDRVVDAFYREKQVQKWSRKKKQALIASDENELHHLAECQNETHYQRAGHVLWADDAGDSAQSANGVADSRVYRSTMSSQVDSSHLLEASVLNSRFNRSAAIMIAAKTMTLEEYLNYDDGTETRYELNNGELIAVPPESELNRRIAMFLIAYFLQRGIPPQRLTMKTEIVVHGARATTRFPDVMILSEELETAMQGARRSTVTSDMPPPLLVVEIVSPGQEKRDYRYKRSEYAARGIAEYWIVDPLVQKVTLLEWVEGFYEEQVYEGDQAIISPLLGVLDLTAVRVLQG
jgi:Uma2 family endonuclease